MTDAMTDLFTAELGLQEPWLAANVRSEPEAGIIHFDVACAATRSRRPRCGAPDHLIHDRLPQDWQRRHFFQYRALVRAQVPRMRVRRVAKLVGVRSDGGLWGSLGALVVDAVRVDDKHIGGGRFVTMAHGDNHATRGRMPHVNEGRKAENVGLLVDALAALGGDPETITRCTTDLSQTYRAGARTHLPNAKICFDPFHPVKTANEVVDAVRRAEAAREPALKRIRRYHWLKGARDWTRKEVGLHWLRQSSLKTVRAWHLKECLRKLLAWHRDLHVPVLLLMERWIGRTRRCGIGAFKFPAATFWRHREGIHNIVAAACSNGTAESINADVQNAIVPTHRLGDLRIVIYLLKAKLDLRAPPYARVV